MRVSSFDFGVAGVWLPGRQRDVGGGEWVEFSLIAAGPRACYRALDGVIRAKLCGSAEVGRLTADGAGLSVGKGRSSEWWVAPGVGLELEAVTRAGWLVRLQADALRPVTRDQYTVDGADVVHAAPQLVPRVGLGAGLVLP